MLNSFGRVARKSSARPRAVPRAVERKDIETTLALLGAGAAMTEWMTDSGDGRGGWIRQALDWLTDERTRIESQSDDLMRRIEDAEARGEDVSALEAELDTLDQRLQELDAAENEVLTMSEDDVPKAARVLRSRPASGRKSGVVHMREYWTLPQELLPRAIAGIEMNTQLLQELTNLLGALPASIDDLSDEEVQALESDWRRAADIAGDLAELAAS